jgi:glycosyltransferase involved in cell wall biosynthesis
MQNPLVSIIIPTFNRASLIQETLNSILAQSYVFWECIIVDDGSTDDTEIVVNKFVKMDSRFRYYHRPANRPKGANTCRNYGFEISKGDYINWFDDDDIMLPDFVEKKMGLFSEEVQMTICTGYLVNEQLKESSIIKIYTSSNIFKDYLVSRLKILTPSILFRKRFLEDKLLFSNNIKRGQETELFSRLFFQLNDSEYIITEAPLFLYRQHVASKTGRNTLYIKSYAESKHIIYTHNFIRGLSINDFEVMNYCYSKNMMLFFNAITNQHFSLAIDIRRNFISKLKNIGLTYYLELNIICPLLILLKFPSYRLQKRWKSFEFK